MTFRTAKATRTALASVFFAAATLSLSGVSFAQGAGQAPDQGWRKVCTKQEDNDVCVVQHIAIASSGQLLTAVGMIIVEGKVNNRMLQVSVPSARTIPPGVAMSVDGGQQQRIPYSVCMPDKCVAQVPLTDGIVDSFKRGGEVVFTSVNFQRAANPIKISLAGFTDAFDGDPIPQSELQASQEKLREEMQRKAQEAREKLEAAQEEAKEQSN